MTKELFMCLAILSDIHGNPLALDAVLADMRRVDYDHEAVIQAIEQSHHPAPSFLITFMRGERLASSDPGFFQASKSSGNQQG
jgi:hypothetical protein